MRSPYTLDKRISVRIPLREAVDTEELMEQLRCRTWSRIVRLALRELREQHPAQRPIKTSDIRRQKSDISMPLFSRKKTATKAKKSSRKRRGKVA
jgi:hypothetical protein